MRAEDGEASKFLDNFMMGEGNLNKNILEIIFLRIILVGLATFVFSCLCWVWNFKQTVGGKFEEGEDNI